MLIQRYFFFYDAPKNKSCLSGIKMSAFGKVVDEALQLQLKGKDKVEVIAHILNGLIDEDLDDEYVVLAERHRREKDCFFVHLLFTEDRPLPFAAALANETLVCEKVVPKLRAPRKMSVPIKKWSFKKLPQAASASSVNLLPKRRLFRVYECRNVTEAQLFASVPWTKVSVLPRDLGTVYLCCDQSIPTAPPVAHNRKASIPLPPTINLDQRAQRLSEVGKTLQFAANTLFIIFGLYRESHQERGKRLKEHIFNEIVQTMTLPLVIFDIPVDAEAVASDPSKIKCTYCNDAFHSLVKRGDQTIKVDLSPIDQQYKDGAHHRQFYSFLSHPKIYEAIEQVMQKHPICLSGHTGGLTHSQSGSLGTPGTARMSLKQSKGKDHSIDGQLHATEAARQGIVLAIEYGDDLIPKSHYEMDIYRVNCTRVGIVFRDVSEKLHDLELIEQASRAKTDFLACLHHQLRNPLNAIDGNLQLLSRTEPLTDRQRDLVHRMRLAESSLMGLLHEVLDYSKLEQRMMVLSNDSFSLRHMIQATLDVMQAAANAKKVSLSYNLEMDVPTLIVGDSWRLQQILVNLVSNSINYTSAPTGKVGINVSLSHDKEGDPTLVFTVTDTGDGIDEKTIEKLFLPWAQADVNITSHRGSGLGLAISKELSHLMKGDIVLEHTELGVGSTFVLQIPLSPADEKEHLNLAVLEMASLKNKQVLLVYPDTSFRRKLLQNMLSWRIKPTTCATTEEAIAFFNADYSFDAIVIGDLCRSCNIESDSETLPLAGQRLPPVNQGLPDTVEDPDKELISLAAWITNNRPDTPLIGIGNSVSSHDEHCMRLFRTVVETPIKPEAFFHIFVNTFFNQHLPSTSVAPLATPPVAQIEEVQTGEKGLKCLVVEDVLENRVVLTEMLNLLGYTDIDTAENGQEMLEILAVKDDYDVVFLDILMPVMNGIDAMKEYRKTHKLGTAPFIVAVTATILITSDPVSYQKAGMDAFLQKPIKLRDLRLLLDIIQNHSKK